MRQLATKGTLSKYYKRYETFPLSKGQSNKFFKLIKIELLLKIFIRKKMVSFSVIFQKLFRQIFQNKHVQHKADFCCDASHTTCMH